MDVPTFLPQCGQQWMSMPVKRSRRMEKIAAGGAEAAAQKKHFREAVLFNIRLHPFIGCKA
jgi:hypothetical protein